MNLPIQTDLSGKVAVVTGGSGVIGGSFCRALAGSGAKVAVLGRRAENGAPVVKEIRQAGGEAAAFACNVTDRASVETARDAVLAEYDRADILVNCAGGVVQSATIPQDQLADLEPGMASFFTVDPEQIHKELDLNLYGTILPTQVFGPALVKARGCVVNLSSMGAYGPLTRIPGYSGAKAAVSNFTQWAANYFARSGVRVNAIAPGFFQTTQNHHLQYDEQGNPTPRTQKILAGTPLGRFGQVEELTGALLFLVSEQAAGFVTGCVLPVDGGFHCYLGV